MAEVSEGSAWMVSLSYDCLLDGILRPNLYFRESVESSLMMLRKWEYEQVTIQARHIHRT